MQPQQQEQQNKDKGGRKPTHRESLVAIATSPDYDFENPNLYQAQVEVSAGQDRAQNGQYRLT